MTYQHRRPLIKNIVQVTPTGNPDYYGFGNAVLLPNRKLLYVAKRGPSHYLDGGTVFGIIYDIATNTWGSVFEIKADGTNYFSGVSAGIIGNHVFIHVAQYTVSGAVDTFIRMGYIKSVDLTTNPDLTSAASWGAYTLFPAPTYERFEAYGKIQPCNAAGKYALPWFEHLILGTDTWRINVRITEDNGDTFSNVQVYDGALKFGEPFLLPIPGTNNSLIFARSNEASPNGKIRLFSSTDDCATWSNVGYTNIGLGTGHANVSAIYQNGLIHLIIQDRSDGMIKISKNNTYAQCLALTLNPMSNYRRSTDSLGGVGYPDITQIYDDLVMNSWCTETSTTECHVYATLDRISLM